MLSHPKQGLNSVKDRVKCILSFQIDLSITITSNATFQPKTIIGCVIPITYLNINVIPNKLFLPPTNTSVRIFKSFTTKMIATQQNMTDVTELQLSIKLEC